MVERITNEEREAIVRKAVAERDALLAAKAQRPACKWPECDCGVSPAQGKAWNCPKQTAHSAAVWNSVCAPGVPASVSMDGQPMGDPHPIDVAAATTRQPERTTTVAIMLNMLRETKGGDECRLPTPACWDLSRYVAQLESAAGVAAPPASKADRVPCSRCTSDIYCEMNGCQHPAAGVQPSAEGKSNG